MGRTKSVLLIYFVILKSIAVDADYYCDSQLSICSIEEQSISESDDFVITANGNSTITFLIIVDGFMPRVPQTIFTKYPDITWLSISNCSLEEISPNVFTNALKLINLLLIYGNLTTISNGTFIQCGKLQSLQIFNQQLSSIDIMAFQGLKILQNLNLADNYLTFLHPLTLSPLKKLWNFDISNNLLTTIDSQQFINNPLLNAVLLSGNRLKTLPNDLFQAQTSLYSLYADHNQLVTAQSFGADNVDFSNNKLRNFTILTGETSIRIENNLIRKIICSSTNLTVQRLYADNNFLTSFLCIRDMVNLTDLHISNNKMKRPTKKAFLKLTNLKELFMYNMTKFTTIPAKILSPLKSLLNLEVDSLVGYKNLNITFPNLYIIGLSTKNWNCTYVSHINNILDSQNIILYQNIGFDGSICEL